MSVSRRAYNEGSMEIHYMSLCLCAYNREPDCRYAPRTPRFFSSLGRVETDTHTPNECSVLQTENVYATLMGTTAQFSEETAEQTNIQTH